MRGRPTIKHARKAAAVKAAAARESKDAVPRCSINESEAGKANETLHDGPTLSINNDFETRADAINS